MKLLEKYRINKKMKLYEAEILDRNGEKLKISIQSEDSDQEEFFRIIEKVSSILHEEKNAGENNFHMQFGGFNYPVTGS